MDDEIGQHLLPWGSPGQYLTSAGQRHSPNQCQMSFNTHAQAVSMYTFNDNQSRGQPCRKQAINCESKSSMRYLQTLSAIEGGKHKKHTSLCDVQADV